MQPFLGDLDEMEQARVIRVLTVYSVGYYYLDQSARSAAGATGIMQVLPAV